jgi:hypothetical protein
MKLWRDYVIATLAIDGGIVFCFALASKLLRFSLCFEIALWDWVWNWRPGIARRIRRKHGTVGERLSQTRRTRLPEDRQAARFGIYMNAIS